MPEYLIQNENHIQSIDNNKLLQRLLDSFSTITKMYVAVTDVNGRKLLASQKEDTEFCRLIKSLPQGLEYCCGSYARAGREAEKWNEPYFFKCHAGLIAWACPIVLDSKHEGNFICGQVLMWEPDEYYIEEILENTEKLGLDKIALQKAIQKLDVISAEQMQAAADLLFVTANYFAQSGISILDYQRKLRTIGSWLWNENHMRETIQQNQVDKTQAEQKIMELEQEIFKEIRCSNKEAAKEALRQLALNFFVRSKGQIEIIKGLSIEFISLMTRFATECGTKFEESIRYSFNKLQELEQADTVEKVILWMLTTGNNYIDLLAINNIDPNEGVINQALSYIQEYYDSKDLSLQVIAEHCHISPSYLSRIFKQKKGCTITEHINKTRVEEAKHLLQQPDTTITDTAKKVGFSDRSYFSKVFKKIMGLSPSDYKKRF